MGLVEGDFLGRQELARVFGVVGQHVNHRRDFRCQCFDVGLALLAGDEGNDVVYSGDEHLSRRQQVAAAFLDGECAPGREGDPSRLHRGPY